METQKVDWNMHVANKYVQHVVNIGDIDVYVNKTLVFVTVDGDTVLSMSRDAGHGLDELADTLKSLVK